MNSRLVLAVDPNIYIAADKGHLPSKDFLYTLQERRDFIKLAFDVDRAIWDTLTELGFQLDTEWLQLISWLLNDKLNMIEEMDIRSHLSDPIFLSHLSANQCDVPVEPALLALGLNQEIDTPVVVTGREYSHPSWKQRGTHKSEAVDKLKNYYPQLTIIPVYEAERHILEWCKTTPSYPHNERELVRLLTNYRWQESDQLEFKHPNPNDPENLGITRSIVTEAMISICAMANAYGGKVLIGIREDEVTKQGKIEGIALSYGNEYHSVDSLERLILDGWLKDFDPPISEPQFRIHTVPLQSGRKVIALQINPLKSVQKFRGKAYLRVGTEDRHIKPR